MGKKKTLVVGASPKPERYAYKAIKLLQKFSHPVETLGLRKAEIDGIIINTEQKQFSNIHTISMYIGPARQTEIYNYLLGLKPKRIIFNPGTENEEFVTRAKKENIEILERCTLIMLNTGEF